MGMLLRRYHKPKNEINETKINKESEKPKKKKVNKDESDK